MSVEYELVDESDPDPREKIAGPQIYTDSSKINGRVGAAITWWANDTESEHQTLSLHPSCSVYQAEMYALYIKVAMVKASRDKVVNILSDSRSSLELLKNPRAGHPLAHAIRESTRNANGEGKKSVSTGREHTWTQRATKEQINWQKPLPKKLIPTMITRKLPYPGYEVARYDLEHKIETKLENQKMHEIMGNPEKRVEFLSFAEKAFREATSRRRSMNRKRNKEIPLTAPTPVPTQKPQENLKLQLQHCAR
ncbi:hypothetical protein EVAR_77429_1 [Eumeta japonica]|uniref:RNase H type-1 domain-containing protein n=1 Tax=Eumeta variegata TaxID=151549 RepID=A0A4C1UYU2_EUMVA|nr:hypothetical protein EVAR_77429_1 [Eumeta japonica]